MNGFGRRRLALPAALGFVLLVGCAGTLWAAAKEKAPPAPPPAARAESKEVSPHVAREAAAPPSHHAKVVGMPAEEALKLLLDGNERVVKGTARGPNRTALRRQELAAGQRPFAVVVTCSDSRVPPELLFDQGYGDLFVVRTAGNVVDAVALGSIEYAVEHLGVRLVVVLGHSRCGAVSATLEGGALPGHLPTIAEAIQPAVEAVRSKPGDLLANCVKANVKLVVQKIMRTSPDYVQNMEECVFRIVGGYYDLDTGKVQLTYQPVI
ncbi:MAG: carbonic anhydrase [Deltaproteobacteria bacterium]|nr:carbonic anhydrase [Deltaproteobacteria bacterium]